MKQTTNLLCAIALGTLALGTGKSLAFPLDLTSVSGTITATARFGADANSTSNKVETVSVSVKNILTLVSNEVVLRHGVHPPANSRISYDPYTFSLFITNNSGFNTNLNGIATFSIRDIATNFHGNSRGGTESDTALVELDVFGTSPDGNYYEFEVEGQGTIVGSLHGTNGAANLTISLSNGAGYGDLKGSSDGVSKGGFTFMGHGTVPSAARNEPYSVWWWNND